MNKEGPHKTLPLAEAEHSIVDEIIALASGFLRDTSEKSQNPFLGTLSIAALARSALDLAVYATSDGQSRTTVTGMRDDIRLLRERVSGCRRPRGLGQARVGGRWLRTTADVQE